MADCPLQYPPHPGLGADPALSLNAGMDPVAPPPADLQPAGERMDPGSPPLPDFAGAPDYNAYRLEWGIDPPSPRRQRRLHVFIWLPTGLYVFFVCLYGAFMQDGEAFIGAPFVSAVVTTTFYLFFLALRRDPLIMHPRNRAEMLLAGMNGREIMLSAAHPLLPALGYMCGLHYLLSLLVIMAIPDGNMPGTAFLFALFIYSTPIVALLLGATMAPSLWVSISSRPARVLILAFWIFAWLVSYWVIYIGLGLILSRMQIDGVDEMIAFYFLFVLGLSVIAPGYLNLVFFRKAIRKLEEIK